jgi:hypothetical protein
MPDRGAAASSTDSKTLNTMSNSTISLRNVANSTLTATLTDPGPQTQARQPQ